MHSAMEQSRYWMWTRRKLTGFPHIQTLVPSSTHGTAVSSYNDSWEEQAFADDSSGRLGGCTWPPRSYSCSFCRKEFRSAQALGGHMNVHRRDRARLQSSPTPLAGFAPDPSLPVCTMAYNSANPSHGNIPPPSPVSPSTRVSLASTHENCDGQKIITSPHPYSSSVTQEQRKTSTLFPSPRSLSDSFTIRAQLSLDLKIGEVIKFGCKEKRKPSEIEGKEEEEEGGITSSKRQRVDVALSFLGLPLADNHHHHLRPDDTVEELDLELRLGDKPKVK